MSKPNAKPCWSCTNPPRERDESKPYYTGFCSECESVLSGRYTETWEEIARLSTPRSGFYQRLDAITRGVKLIEEHKKARWAQ